VANSHSTPTYKAAEPTTGDSAQEVLQHELAALRRSEALLRDFIETSTIGLHWVGADGTILWVNQAELDLLGYSMEEYLGRNIAEFHADESVINDILGRLRQGETLRDYSARLRHHDGSIRHVLINSSVLFEDGKFVHTRCFTRNVTSLKQEQDVSRQLAAIVDSSDDAIFSKNLDGIVESWNAGAEKLFGYPAEEIIGKPVSVLLPPDRLSEFLDILAKIRTGVRLEHYEVTRMRKDGRRVDISVTISPIKDNVGCLVGTSTIARDITDRRQADAALRESEERFRFAQSAAGIGTFDWNIETGVNTWTPELEAMYGLAPGDFQGTQETWEHLVHPDDRARIVQQVNESFETGAPTEEEWRVIWPDGSLHWIAGRWQVFKDPSGEPLHMIGINIDITDRKNIEETLRKSEERYRLATKATNDAIWDVDLKTNTVSWNETYAALYGRPPDTSGSWQWWIDNIHPEDREHSVGSLRAAIDGSESSWTCEYRLRRRDRGWAHIHDRAYIARNASGVAYRVIGAMQDLTEQKQAEAALRESEERFRNMADTAPVMIWLSGPDKLGTFFNKAWLDFTGRTMEQECEQGWISGVHPDDLDHCLSTCGAAFHARRAFQIDFRLRRADGEYRWILCAGVPRYRGEEFIGFISSCLDLTERKLMEERLRASETRLKGAQRLARIGSWERDIELGNAHWSDEMFRIFGLYNEGAPTFSAFLNYIYPEDRRRLLEAHRQIRSTTAPVHTEYRITRPDGEMRWVRGILEAVRDNRGALVSIVGVSQDVTDQKRSQEQEFIRQKLESVGTLASGIAHDFNNLLGAVLAQAELAMAELASGSHPHEELKEIRDVAIRGSDIVRQLMIYAGQEGDALELVDVSNAVQGLLGLLKVTVSRHAALVTDLGENLPPVQARVGQIRQIVMNLVVNASDAIQDCDGVVRVTTRLVSVDRHIAGAEDLSKGDYVQLEVSDTGRGMSQETQARMFDPFFTTKSAGRGLGLAVVHGIVRSLRGAIRVVSELGKGTTFEILLPCVGTAAPDPTKEIAGIGQIPPLSRPATVLVVEDEEPLHLHPGDAGYKAMGESIDLSLFR